MAKYAFIVDGIVDTVSIARKPSNDWIEVPDDVYSGFVLQEDGSFLPPEPPEKTREELYPPLAPWKFHAIIRVHNLNDQLESIISSMDNITQAVVRSKLDKVFEYHRDDPLIDQLGAALGLNSSDIDAIWSQANGLE